MKVKGASQRRLLDETSRGKTGKATECFSAAHRSHRSSYRSRQTRHSYRSEALSHERVAVQAGQARLEAAAREITVAQDAATKANIAAKKSGEEAAELRGQLTAAKKPARTV